MDKKQQAYEYLKEKILKNELKPETPIIEVDMAKELGMSRAPVREAMQNLEKDGLVVSYPFRGSYVSSATPYDVEEMYELRILLEGWALERGFSRFTKEELDDLEKLFTTAYQKNDWEKLHEADRALHNMIIEKALCKRLISFMDTLNAQIERIRYISAREVQRSEKSYQEHLEIIHCIRDGKRDEAKKLLEVHLHSVAESAIEVARYEAVQRK